VSRSLGFAIPLERGFFPCPSQNGLQISSIVIDSGWSEWLIRFDKFAANFGSAPPSHQETPKLPSDVFWRLLRVVSRP
jgi:hypothetical protein